jgi:hypothetical protein
VPSLWPDVADPVHPRDERRQAVNVGLGHRVEDVVNVAQQAPGLSEAQKSRVNTVLRQFLNNAPIRDRLVAALKRDAVPFTELELEALGRVRQPRTRAQHGKPWIDPAEADLEIAKGFATRVLAYWGETLAGDRSR